MNSKNILVIKFTIQLLIKKIVLTWFLLTALKVQSFLEIDLMTGDNWYLERLITLIKTAVLLYQRVCSFFKSHSKQMWQTWCLKWAAECKDHLYFDRHLPPAWQNRCVSHTEWWLVECQRSWQLFLLSLATCLQPPELERLWSYIAGKKQNKT